MSVAENFKAFRVNYLIPSDTVNSISYRYKRITRQLNRDFWDADSDTSHSIYVGSYGRDTAVNGVSDLDIAFTLPNNVYHRYNGYAGNGQSALLQAVKNSISNTYSSSYLGGDGQVVALEFTDGIRFEILPTFLNNDGKTFTYPDSNGGGSWKVCNPRSEIEAIRIRNSVTANGNLKAICRMVRVWRDKHDVPMSGILIDSLAYQWIASWPHRDKSFLYHDYLVRDFFLHLSQTDRGQQYWRALGSESFVWKKGNFQSPAKVAYEIALKAIAFESNNMPATARSAWKQIFGGLYP